MAKGIRALLDTVMQALPQVGNLGLLFFLLFFIFAALGVEMFGRLGIYNTTHTETCYTLLNKQKRVLEEAVFSVYFKKAHFYMQSFN